MNNIEAIEQLKWLRNKSQLRIDEDFTEPLDMAISVLEKQIAKPCTYCQKKRYNYILQRFTDSKNRLRQ